MGLVFAPGGRYVKAAKLKLLTDKELEISITRYLKKEPRQSREGGNPSPDTSKLSQLEVKFWLK